MQGEEVVIDTACTNITVRCCFIPSRAKLFGRNSNLWKRLLFFPFGFLLAPSPVIAPGHGEPACDSESIPSRHEKLRGSVLYYIPHAFLCKDFPKATSFSYGRCVHISPASTDPSRRRKEVSPSTGAHQSIVASAHTCTIRGICSYCCVQANMLTNPSLAPRARFSVKIDRE